MTFYSDPDGYKIIRTCGANFCELNFLCCDNSSILKAFLLLLPRKNVVAKKKRENKGTSWRIHCPIFFFAPTLSAKKARIAGTIWKQKGNSLQYMKGFCSKAEFLSPKSTIKASHSKFLGEIFLLRTCQHNYGRNKFTKINLHLMNVGSCHL